VKIWLYCLRVQDTSGIQYYNSVPVITARLDLEGTQAIQTEELVVDLAGRSELCIRCW